MFQVAHVQAGGRRHRSSRAATSTRTLGQKEGFVAPHLKARATAELLVYMGESSLYRLIGVANETDDARYPDPLAELYWRTLYEGYRDPLGSAG